jgi:hypothetical protein
MVSVRIYWLCRLFNDVPATSARFPRFEHRNRSHAPPCQVPRRCVSGERDPTMLPAGDPGLDGVGDGGETVLVAEQLDEPVGDDDAHEPVLGVGETDGAEGA